jgi:hypothetical protein
MMTFGMSVVLSLWAPTTAFLWRYFLAHMLLSFVGAALASFPAGLLVLPSLATEAAMQAVITALRKTGQTGTLCVSILLRPQQEGLLPGATKSLEQHSQWQQQQQRRPASGMSVTSASGISAAGSLAARSAFSEAARAADSADSNSATPAAALATTASATSNMEQQQQGAPEGLPTAPSSELQQQPSLLEEVPESAGVKSSAELQRMVALSKPGHWGLRSFVVAAASSSSQTSQQQQQQHQEDGKQVQPNAAAVAAAIAAAATVPGEEEAAASEAAASEEHEDVEAGDDVSSW